MYFPLGGSRVRPILVWRNLAAVWLLTGLWHGAAWTFVAWGGYFGLIIGLEHFVIGPFLSKIPRVAQHAYGLIIALLGWVIFRAQDMAQVGHFFAGMLYPPSTGHLWDDHADIILRRGWVVMVIAIILATGIGSRTMEAARSVLTAPQEAVLSSRAKVGITVTGLAVIVGLILATALIVGATSHPFIYLRF